MRHGYRNPAQFFKDDKTREKFGWGWEGASQLTNIGKNQAYSFGKFLRQRYEKLIPVDFKVNEVKCVSSSAERCQMTLFSMLAGLFPPVGHAVWNQNLAWQPSATEINDPLLRMYNVKCPSYTSAYQPISDDNLPRSKDWLNSKKDLIQYISKNTGFNGSLSDLADAADNVQSMVLNKVDPMPDWIEKPTLNKYTKEEMIKEIISFAEAHQIQCAEEKECAKAMAGLWLNQILDLLNQKKDKAGKLKDRKAHLYACHTETVLSLMKLLKMNVSETPTSAGLLLEFKIEPASVRTFFHEPDEHDPTVRKAHKVDLPYCAGQDWCPLDTFVKSVSDSSFSNWQEYCKVPACATS
jgi:hypothetical protein